MTLIQSANGASAMSAADIADKVHSVSQWLDIAPLWLEL
jgi:hypothetical protein